MQVSTPISHHHLLIGLDVGPVLKRVHELVRVHSCERAVRAVGLYKRSTGVAMLDRRQATIVGRPLCIGVLSLSFQDFLAKDGSKITPTLEL